ncbi:MAG: DUF547 domain-containing protein [Pseudomonadota bacterium]
MRHFLIAALAALLLASPARAGFERLFVPKVALENPVWLEHSEGSGETVDHGAWDGFLARYLETDTAGINRIAYGDVTEADRAALDSYLQRLQDVDPRKLDQPEQLAFWINLYNAETVDVILENYPVDSIRDISTGLFGLGPWDDKLVTVIGRKLSLNDIEHGIVRPVYGDARIHYALNCAAASCPNLGKKAYRGATLEQELASAERAYVNDPRGISRRNGLLVISSIYVWFREDFAQSEEGVLDYLRQHADGPAKAALDGKARADDHAYDWALNGR